MRMYHLSGFLFLLLFFSCTTISGRYESETGLTPGKQNITVLTLTQASGDNRTAAVLTSPLFPAVTIHGDIERKEQGFVFFITGARLFANWPDGWTEGNYEASGKLAFTEGDKGVTCNIEDPFKLWDIVSGEIRRYDVYYRKDDGLLKVKNRVDRIFEISRFLRERRMSPVYGHIKQETMYGPGFSGEIVAFLFPEQRRRTDYSQEVFPEHLRQLRDSGTLWLDFEEAPLLFFSLYNITYFFDSIIKDESFVKIK